MGAKVSVRNNTPYTWYYAKRGNGYNYLAPGSSASYEEGRAVHCYIHFRYGNHSWDSFVFEFNTHKGDTTFTLSEVYSRSQIQLYCSSEGISQHCPNHGKIEEDERFRQQEEERRRLEHERRVQQERERRRQFEEAERKRQQEEERRRLERLEREQRIQEELDGESKLSRQRLSQATERLREKQSFRGQQQHHERTQALHQQIEDDAAAIERDEVLDVEEKFKELLSKYQITEDEEVKQYMIWRRIKTLQNELTDKYCRENNLSMWSQFTFDRALAYNDLSLTEKLTVLEASLQFVLHSSDKDAGDQLPGWEKKYDFLLGLVEQLQTTNLTLANHILLSALDMILELSPESRNILGQMLFNRIWTPEEIMLFICKSPVIKSDLLDSILHTAQTYHLDCILVLSALKDENPLMFLQEQVRNDKEKDADTIVKELREANCPEQILVLLKDVLRYIESEIPNYQSNDHTEEEIEYLKRNITSLDLTNPDINILKYVLIRMSVAIQDCTTITKDNQEIPGYFPRLTQLASLLLLLLPQLTSNKGCLLEIGTGEGKSCILAMFATILAIRGTKVDIVTSSPVLARRDQEEWKRFFQMFGITSSVVPPPFSSNYSAEKQENCLRDAYRQQIVYGTVGVFAADTLKQEFEKRTTRDTRQFELVIVDEVDYMTLDNGVQVTFLSHESSGFRHVEQVLSNIWAMISNCQPIQMLETGEIKWATRMQCFHKAVTAAVMAQGPSDSFSANEILLPGVPLGFYTQEDIEMIQAESKKTEEGQGDGNQGGMSKALSEVMKKLGVPQQYDLLSVFEEVLENSVVFKCYSLENKKAKFFGAREKPAELIVDMLLLEGGLACEIMSEKSLVDATVSTIQSLIKFSDNLPTTEESTKCIVIPAFLKSYVENQLPVFVENALKAVEMSRGREYMIDTSQAAEREVAYSPDRHEYNAIIPVDFKASGVLEKNKKWGNGLQQFLEFKHQLAISPISNVTNYMSNFHFFKRYLSGSGIFGVSGTLGGKADRDFLARHYEAESYTIPAHRHKRLIELPVIQVKGGNDQWIQTICEASWKAAERGQVVLVICEDVKTADVLHEKIQGGGRFKTEQITLYTISEKHNIEKEKFCGGRIIIATNLGGRGTDIKVDQTVNECGGLFVVLTHFPHNRRVEKQIFGRTSRKGNPGMVQMVVNSDHLAPAYQGQSVEIMRQLREDYEIKRIHDMESDELLEINLKEILFSTFCMLLQNFDGNYTPDEKQDPMRLQLNDIPDCFKCYQHKFDYQPAVNALKESWALWLTLHEEHINRHDDVRELKADLTRTITKTSAKLLQGECDNFYDHVRQAIVRTDLHCRNKSANDYGAEAYWKNVVTSDQHYKAVALYNRAYITINLSRDNCKAEAVTLLEAAKESIAVYISEVSNTMILCNLAVTGNKGQSTNYNNFQSQMEARMNIFKSWMKYIENAVKKLKELEDSGKEAETESCSVYLLSEDKNFITTNELRALYDYGLGVVFEVKEKPKFCLDALLCFILGAVQVLAGVLVCALTLGTASQFGLGLISEGVSDMINGIEGMITGTFDWASWAISKSISIGISLLTAGFSIIKKAATSVFKVTKGLLTGTKSFTSVASDIMKSGKAMFSSVKQSFHSGVSHLSKESLKSAVKTMTSSTALKQNFMYATKYAVQEIGKRSVLTAMNYAIDAALERVFKEILVSAFKNIVMSLVKQSHVLEQTLVEFISSDIPKAALNKENFKIDQEYEKQVNESVNFLCQEITPYLIQDSTKEREVISRLSEVCEQAADLMKKAEQSGVHEIATLVLKVADYSSRFVQILNAIPTQNIICQEFVPQLIKSISELQENMTTYDQDGRHNLHDVQRLKGELLEIIAQKVSEQFVDSCYEHIIFFLTSGAKGEFTSNVGQAVDRVMCRAPTERFFNDQRQKHNKKSASHKQLELQSAETTAELLQYAEDMSRADRPATELDVYVLTSSNLLHGKGIQLTVVNENGKLLTEERYPGANKSAGDIKLILTKATEVLHPSQAGGELYCGHFDIVEDDGRIISVDVDHRDAIYGAVAQASGGKMEDVNEEALVLREKVKNEIRTNLETYAPVINLQRGYDFCHVNPGKYGVPGGSQKEVDPVLQEHLQRVTFIRSDERVLIKMYHLGFVGENERVLSARESRRSTTRTVDTSHIPPKDSIRRALTGIESSPSVNEFKNKNPELYKLISRIKTDNNGLSLIAMEVLGQDHRRALTTGPSSRSQAARNLLADTMISGDVELLLKRCMILHHPLTSQKLRDALGDSVPSQSPVLSDDGVRGYYKAGYRSLVCEYSRLGVLDKDQSERLDVWVTQDQHEDADTTEYHQVLQQLAGKGDGEHVTSSATHDDDDDEAGDCYN